MALCLRMLEKYNQCILVIHHCNITNIYLGFGGNLGTGSTSDS